MAELSSHGGALPTQVKDDSRQKSQKSAHGIMIEMRRVKEEAKGFMSPRLKPGIHPVYRTSIKRGYASRFFSSSRLDMEWC